MKKILLFTDSMSSGGAQRQLVALAKELKRTGYDVFLLDYWDDTFFDEELNASNIVFEHRLTKGKWNIIKMFRYAVKDYKPDVVISYMENPSIIACVAKLLTNIKFRLIVSERNTTQHINRNTLIRFNLFRLADYIVPNSYSQQIMIEENFSYLRNKIKTITNFVDTDTFWGGEYENRKEKALRLLVVGRIVEQKNVLRFIDAINILKTRGLAFIVDWYGRPFPETYYEQCLSKIKEYGLESFLRFHPHTKDILNEYQNSDIFVLPSIYEGFPNVLCEAMSCCLPVVVSNVCDNPRIVEDGVNGYLFDPLNVTDMADKIWKMLSMEQPKRMKMGKKGREIIDTKFNKSNFIRHYIEIIE